MSQCGVLACLSRRLWESVFAACMHRMQPKDLKGRVESPGQTMYRTCLLPTKEVLEKCLGFLFCDLPSRKQQQPPSKAPWFSLGCTLHLLGGLKDSVLGLCPGTQFNCAEVQPVWRCTDWDILLGGKKVPITQKEQRRNLGRAQENKGLQAIFCQLLACVNKVLLKYSHTPFFMTCT